MTVCPLVFEPIFKPKVWGGNALARRFNKNLPTDQRIGESWECVDLPAASSIVARGPQKGKSLHQLVESWGDALLGRCPPVRGRFPLLVKFLDAADMLSIQVHPGDQDDPDAKHEAWHVIEAAPGAVIYRGLRPGVTLDDFRRQVAHDPSIAVDLLQPCDAKAGRSYYLPGGTIHALGNGVVVAEVQTPSDATYRIYDWGRSRPEGDAGLHIDKALAAARIGQPFATFEKRSHVSSAFTTVTRRVTAPSFIMEQVRFVGGVEQPIPYAELVIWIILQGSGEIRYSRSGVESFRAGEVVVLPAKLPEPALRTLEECVWLEVTIPAPSDLADYRRPDAATLRSANESHAGPIPLNVRVDSHSEPSEPPQ